MPAGPDKSAGRGPSDAVYATPPAAAAAWVTSSRIVLGGAGTITVAAARSTKAGMPNMV